MEDPDGDLSAAVLLRAVLEALPDPVIVTDPRRRILLANWGTAAAFGYEQRELSGRPLDLLLPAVVSGDQAIGRRKGGCEFPVEVSVRAARPGPGSLEVVCVRATSERSSGQATGHAEGLAAFGLLAEELGTELREALGILFLRIDAMVLEAGETRLSPQVQEDLHALRRVVQRLGRTLEGVLDQGGPPTRIAGPVNTARLIEDSPAASNGLSPTGARTP